MQALQLEVHRLQANQEQMEKRHQQEKGEAFNRGALQADYDANARKSPPQSSNSNARCTVPEDRRPEFVQSTTTLVARTETVATATSGGLTGTGVVARSPANPPALTGPTAPTGGGGDPP